MEKINFENYPSTNSPINATNLNLLQENVENAINGSKVGDIIVTSTNTDPSERFGGTWELIDKEFKSETSSSNDLFTENSTNCEISSCYYTRGGHSIQIRLYFTNKVALTDSTVDLGDFDFESLGVTSFPFGLNNLVGSSDDGNGIFIATLGWDSGELNVTDVIAKNESIAANSSCRLLFDVEINYNRMIDSFCDKFYWKRVA